MQNVPAKWNSADASKLDGLVQLALSQAPFAALLFRPDVDLTLLWRNSAHEAMSSSSGRDIVGMPMFSAFPPGPDAESAAAKDAIAQSVARISASLLSEEIGPYRYDLVDDTGKYQEHHWHMRMSPVLKDGALVAILQVAQDVTQTVLSARVAASLQRSARTTAGLGYFSFDPESDVFERSSDIDAMFGFEPGEAGAHAASFVARIHPDDLPGVQAEVARVFSSPKGEVASFDYRALLPDRTERFLRIRGEVVTDPADRRDKLVGSFVDLTDIEESRQALKRALEMREALMAEANHRIKNSLAIAVSMLRLQRQSISGQAADAPVPVSDVLSAVEARIQAVADVHSLMQLREHDTTVSIRSLLNRLVDYTRRSGGVDPSELRLELGPNDVALPGDKAINLGLIANELLVNAVKYGADSNGRRDVDVVATINSSQIEIEIANSIARSEPEVALNSTGLGSRLVDQLSAALGVSIDRQITSSRCSVRLTMVCEASDLSASAT